jgi:hypothetical protein
MSKSRVPPYDACESSNSRVKTMASYRRRLAVNLILAAMLWVALTTLILAVG